MVHELPDTIHSPEQLKACALEMDRVIAWRQRQDVKRKTGNTFHAVPDFEFRTQLPELIGSPELVGRLDRSELEAWRKQFDEWLKQPVTHITFAAPPPAATRLAMIRWFRGTICPSALIAFEVNRTIVGGLVIRTPGKIFDLSFRRRLVRHQSLIPELLRRA